MELIQAFLLGIMVAWTPSLIVLAVLLRDVRWSYGSASPSNLVRGSTEPRTNAATAAGRPLCAARLQLRWQRPAKNGIMLPLLMKDGLRLGWLVRAATRWFR